MKNKGIICITMTAVFIALLIGAQAAVISALFSFPQLSKAVIGGALAVGLSLKK